MSCELGAFAVITARVRAPPAAAHGPASLGQGAVCGGTWRAARGRNAIAMAACTCPGPRCLQFGARAHQPRRVTVSSSGGGVRTVSIAVRCVRDGEYFFILSVVDNVNTLIRYLLSRPFRRGFVRLRPLRLRFFFVFFVFGFAFLVASLNICRSRCRVSPGRRPTLAARAMGVGLGLGGRCAAPVDLTRDLTGL